MFEDLLNNEVTVMVSPRAQEILEYNGMLVKEDEKTIVLKNVSISYALLDFQKNIFGGNISTYKQNIETVIINKRYVISCNKK